MTVASFNRICRVVSLIWLIVGIPLTLKYRPVAFDDFGQFYMGGLIARHHAWKALYPVPRGESLYNPGSPKDATPRPEFQNLRQEKGVHGDLNFIQSPPTALLLEPLAFLSYRHARWAWILLCGLCAWGTAVIGGETYCLASGKTSRFSGVITVLIAFSYLVYSTLRSINCEAIVALMLGLTIVAIARRQEWRGAVAIVLGMMLKYSNVILIPLAIACRRCRMLAASLVLAGAGLAMTWGVCGSGPFQQFTHDIAPRLGRAFEDSPNQSMVGFLMRVRQQVPLAPGLSMAVALVAGVVLLGILDLLLRIRPSTYNASPVPVLAGAAALIAWACSSSTRWSGISISFSFARCGDGWGGRRPKAAGLILIVAIIACIAGPWHLLGAEDWHEPFNSHMLWVRDAGPAVGVIAAIGPAIRLAA